MGLEFGDKHRFSFRTYLVKKGEADTPLGYIDWGFELDFNKVPKAVISQRAKWVPYEKGDLVWGKFK
jgi:hypothetical protein